LENATGFDKDNWPDMADPKFWSKHLPTLRLQALLEDVAQITIGVTRDTRRKGDLPTSVSITTERNNHETVHIT
jgi:hypothetical protein